MKKSIRILGIETSCDETAAAIVEDGRYILSNKLYSQIEIHKKFGGVVPEIASRNHIQKISGVIDEALSEANMTFADLDAIAVTYGPGLVGALLVGVSTAKALSFSLNKPLIPVNHMEGHIFANYITYMDLEPPCVCLIVSGGHTHLVHVQDYGRYRILGRTRDDAVGEAYDKVARTLGLPYPGGPQIDKLAMMGDPKAINFPRAYLDKDSLDFSFSGLKSAVLNYINQTNMKRQPIIKENVAASFQASVVEVLVNKTLMAVKNIGTDKLLLAGGVSANSELRKQFKDICYKKGINLYYPKIELCTDNAAMIASAGYYGYIRGDRADMTLNAVASLALDSK